MEIQKNSDLHMHSTKSDGGYSPSDLMSKCNQNKLEIVSLTDHDTVDGIEEAIIAAQKFGIVVIPGIELSTVHKGKSVHILGYNFDWKNKELQKMLLEQKNLRAERLTGMIQKLSQMNVQVSADRIIENAKGGTVGRPHVAKALIEAGYVESVAEAFDRFLAEGKPAYVEKSKELSVKEAIDWIHHAGGLAIVAHPVYYYLDDDIIEWVEKWHLDGVEVYHRDHDKQTIQRYEELCDRLDQKRVKPLFRTGGSDFHHEEYGRVLQPLGVTRIYNSFAMRVIQDKERSN